MKRTVRYRNIFLASPSDVADEREIVSKVVDQLNDELFEPEGHIFKVVKWEKDTYPLIDGRDGQEIINTQLVLKEFSNYDLFIGVMWKKFGTETPPCRLWHGRRV